ncbi:hypothetical protein LPY66_16850 [Dehalobacter sp. DCM]|uniref:hypothetical protein n=1 Tax=Dehalobacter sp. DCM TaxID=2907827 RepID=UPI00308190B5|nr:hypothetical protein LPY66_16850 [Dehalobacter sp. DCM]
MAQEPKAECGMQTSPDYYILMSWYLENVVLDITLYKIYDSAPCFFPSHPDADLLDDPLSGESRPDRFIRGLYPDPDFPAALDDPFGKEDL